MRIPMLDLTADIKAHREEYLAALSSVLDTTEFILGREVRAFEEEAAAYLGVKHAVSMNSGTDALLIGLRALGVKAGDEVVTSAFSFFATAETISLLGAKPVFADIDPATFNLDSRSVAALLTSRTKTIVLVHLFGLPAEMESIRSVADSKGIPVLKDAAQAFGAVAQGKPVGGIGAAAAFSVYPTKNLGAFGDGGLLTTNDAKVAEQARLLRGHGSKKRYHHEAFGYTSRLDEMQAAILRRKLTRVDAMNGARRRAAGRYDEALKGIAGLTTPVGAPEARHIYHQYTVRIANGRRDEVVRALSEREISSIIYYPIPLHRLDLYKGLDSNCPNADRAAEEVLSLPLWPEIPVETQLEVVSALRGILGA